jgi:hypothetical protein
MHIRLFMALAATLVVVFSAGVASAHPISAACLAGPGSPTCFRPNLIITGDSNVTIPPLFVEVVQDGSDIILSMQANLAATTEFIGNVRMNLDPSIDPDSLTFTFLDGTTDIDVPNDVHITTAANGISQPPSPPGTGGFDIGFDFPPPPGNTVFDGNELIEWTVTCTGTNCDQFGVTSFNFVNSGGFRICTHVQGVPGEGEGSTLVCGTPGSNNVPEPATLALLGAGLLGFGFIGKRISSTTRT